MGHECGWCGQACYCDQEDTWLEQPDDCECPCDTLDDDEDLDEWPEDDLS